MTSLKRGISEELVVPIYVGATIFILNIGVLGELAVVGAFIAVLGAITGFALGVLSLPIYFSTGLGFSPPVLSPRFSDSHRSSESWTVHVVSAVYYSYLAAFLVLGLGFVVTQWLAPYDDPPIAAISGFLVGFLFVFGQIWGATRETYSLTISDIGLWLVYGTLLVIPARLLILFLNSPAY